MNKFILQTGMAVLMTASVWGMMPLVASADSIGPITFETPTYTAGDINGQDGWIKTGAFDVDVAVTSGAPGSFGLQSLRISDSVTSGSFGDQTFAKPLTDSAGETASTNGTFSPGTKQTHYEMQFDLASVQLAQQPGMHMSVSPDRGDGSRMSYLRFEDDSTGIHVYFVDVTDPGPLGIVASFNETDLGVFSRSVPHTIKLTMDFVDGPANDVVKVYVDGVLVHTGTSWEDYYRFDPESVAEQSPRIVKTVLFRESGTATPANDGKGYLVDNFSQLSGPTPASTVKVVIDKYIDGVQATALSANNSAFPMTATWNAINLGAGSGNYDIGVVGFNSPNPYEAITGDMTAGADYTTSEITGGSIVGASCADGKPYALVGYKSGNSVEAANASSTSLTAPVFTALNQDAYVIVLNKICVPTPTHVSPADGSTVTTVAMDKIDWNDVTDPAGGITYVYQASNSSAINPDGSFVSPVYTSSALATSEIPTPGTPDGTYYWHVKAMDAHGNESAWSNAWQVIVGNTAQPSLIKVHILKYIDGVKADALTVPGGYQFPMTATWMTANLNGGVSTSGNYVLGNNHGGAPDLYGADTASMQAPAEYTTSEVTDGTSNVLPTESTCVAGKYQLLGYKVSDTSFADAVTQSTSTAPVFTGLGADKYVLVYNRTCPTTASLTVQKITIGGNATFTFTGDNGIGSFQITTVSNGGSQTFTNLAPGTYHITENPLNKWTKTDTTCDSITLAAGDAPVCVITNTNNKLLGSIRGTKYEDRDGDGKLKDSDNHRLSGWTIYLDTNDNNQLDSGEKSTVTDSHGLYYFVGLPAGTYHVREVQQTGWIATYPSTNPVNDKYDIVLSAGQNAKKKDFGNFHLGTISGLKYNDANGNGKKDANEVGLAGWTIQLKKQGGPVVSAVTLADGTYSFIGLNAGTYTLSEVQQSGWRQTQHPGSVKIKSGTVSTNDNFGNTQKVIVAHHDDHDNEGHNNNKRNDD